MKIFLLHCQIKRVDKEELWKNINKKQKQKKIIYI